MAAFVQKVLQKNHLCFAHQIQRWLSYKTVQQCNRTSLHLSSCRNFHCTPMSFVDTYYTETHEWIKVDKNVGTIGITDFAQEQLGDIAFCDLPEVGTNYKKGECFATIESVKAASDLYMPISAEILEKNSTLVDTPSNINESPFDKGWIVKVKIDDASIDDLKDLLDEKAYEEVKSNASDD